MPPGTRKKGLPGLTKNYLTGTSVTGESGRRGKKACDGLAQAEDVGRGTSLHGWVSQGVPPSRDNCRQKVKRHQLSTKKIQKKRGEKVKRKHIQ